MTKTEHGGTGSVMNNLSSCPSRAASSARRGAPTTYYQISRVAWGPPIPMATHISALCHWQDSLNCHPTGARTAVGLMGLGNAKCLRRSQFPLTLLEATSQLSFTTHIVYSLIYIFGRVFPVSPCLTLLVPNLTNLYSRSILHQIAKERELWSEPTLGSENTNLIVH